MAAWPLDAPARVLVINLMEVSPNDHTVLQPCSVRGQRQAPIGAVDVDLGRDGGRIAVDVDLGYQREWSRLAVDGQVPVHLDLARRQQTPAFGRVDDGRVLVELEEVGR